MINFSKPSISRQEIREIVKILKSGWITTGYKNKEFAQKINSYIGSKYCIPVNSCTAALHLALLCAGIGPGDEVITTPMTFTATANVILYTGATPVFVDIKKNDFIIDEEKIEEKISKKTKAIVAVHYGGFSADLDKLHKICKKYNLELIEDGAHAFGSKYKNTFVGKNSKYCCYSFYPTKNITTAEGGALVTNDKQVYERAKILALHGITHDAWKRYNKEGIWKYDVKALGYKYNLPDINAALGIAQLRRIHKMQKKRQQLYKLYRKLLSNIAEIEFLVENTYTDPFRHLLVVLIKSKKISRDQFIQKLKNKRIICSVHFIPLYKFSLYKKLFKLKKDNFPITEKLFSKSVSLPFGADLAERDVRVVAHEIKRIFGYD